MTSSRVIATLSFIVLCGLFMGGCAQNQAPTSAQPPALKPLEPFTPAFTGQYLGKPAPDRTPTLFAQAVIRSAAPEVHSVCQFSPDGHEVLWSAMTETSFGDLYYSKLENGEWTKPVQPPFGKPGDDSPTWSPDGKRLYFVRTEDPDPAKYKESIYYVDRTAEGWGEPIRLPDTVNSLSVHWQLSIASNGDLYFGGREGDTSTDIYCAKCVDGQFAKAEKLGSAINSEDPAVYEISPFIAKDGSYLLFSRVSGDRRDADLYASFQNKDGSWAKAIRFDAICGDSPENCPWVSQDGEFLFFTSMRTGSSLCWWVDAQVIEDMRPR